MKNTFRIIAFLEGVSYILLLFIAVPIKYTLGDSTYVKLLGMPHGLLFVTYIIFAYMLYLSNNKKLLRYLANTILFIVIWFIPTFTLFVISLSINGTKPSGIAGIGGIVAIIISYTVVKRMNKSKLWSRLFLVGLVEDDKKWNKLELFFVLSASLIPFGTFYIDKKYLRK